MAKKLCRFDVRMGGGEWITVWGTTNRAGCLEWVGRIPTIPHLLPDEVPTAYQKKHGIEWRISTKRNAC